MELSAGKMGQDSPQGDTLNFEREFLPAFAAHPCHVGAKFIIPARYCVEHKCHNAKMPNVALFPPRIALGVFPLFCYTEWQ
jgi:hypothetical protein